MTEAEAGAEQLVLEMGLLSGCCSGLVRQVWVSRRNGTGYYVSECSMCRRRKR